MRFSISRPLLACVLLLALYGCVTSSNNNPHELESTTVRADGSEINWKLAVPNLNAPSPLLLVAQGSGCSPARSNPNIVRLATMLPEYALLTIEKYGVDPEVSPDDPMNNCPEAFYEHHTISRRVDDAKLTLRDLSSRGLWDGRLVLFGGSEGGAVVSVLSHEVKNVDAVVVFSTGTGLTMAEFFPMVVPPPVANQMKAVFAQARSNPASQGVAGGNSMKWWADILDRRLSDDLLKSTAPVLLIHGVNDRHVPVAAAKATQKAFADEGQAGRLTYWEFSNRDHQMVDEDGKSHIETVLKDVAVWVRSRVQ